METTHWKFTVTLIFSTLIQSAFGVISIIDSSNNTIREIDDVEADFGKSLYFDNVLGYLNLVSPANACSQLPQAPNISGHIIPGTNTTMTYYPMFALIASGNCSFGKKVFNAQQAGYAAAIVFNSVDDNIYTMHGDQYGRFVHIVAVMVSQDGGKILLRYQYKSGFFMSISPFLATYALYYFIAFLVVLGFSFLVLTIIFVVGLFRNWRLRRGNRLSKRHLRKIPQKKFKKGEDYYETCAICLDDFEDGEKLRILPCNHAFHSKCVDPWLLKNNRNCPVCKRRIAQLGDDPNTTPARDTEEGDGSRDAGDVENISTPALDSSINDSSRSNVWDPERSLPEWSERTPLLRQQPRVISPGGTFRPGSTSPLAGFENQALDIDPADNTRPSSQLIDDRTDLSPPVVVVTSERESLAFPVDVHSLSTPVPINAADPQPSLPCNSSGAV